MLWSGFLEFNDMRNGRSQAMPILRFFVELTPAEPGERIEFGAAIIFRGFPGGFDPALLFQLVQRGIQRAVTHLQNISRNLLQPLANGEAIERLKRQDLQ
jgi:hypothetical protein